MWKSYSGAKNSRIWMAYEISITIGYQVNTWIRSVCLCVLCGHKAKHQAKVQAKLRPVLLLILGSQPLPVLNNHAQEQPCSPPAWVQVSSLLGSISTLGVPEINQKWHEFAPTHLHIFLEMWVCCGQCQKLPRSAVLTTLSNDNMLGELLKQAQLGHRLFSWFSSAVWFGGCPAHKLKPELWFSGLWPCKNVILFPVWAHP